MLGKLVEKSERTKNVLVYTFMPHTLSPDVIRLFTTTDAIVVVWFDYVVESGTFEVLRRFGLKKKDVDNILASGVCSHVVLKRKH